MNKGTYLTRVPSVVRVRDIGYLIPKLDTNQDKGGKAPQSSGMRWYINSDHFLYGFCLPGHETDVKLQVPFFSGTFKAEYPNSILSSASHSISRESATTVQGVPTCHYETSVTGNFSLLFYYSRKWHLGSVSLDVASNTINTETSLPLLLEFSVLSQTCFPWAVNFREPSTGFTPDVEKHQKTLKTLGTTTTSFSGPSCNSLVQSVAAPVTYMVSTRRSWASPQRSTKSRSRPDRSPLLPLWNDLTRATASRPVPGTSRQHGAVVPPHRSSEKSPLWRQSSSRFASHFNGSLNGSLPRLSSY